MCSPNFAAGESSSLVKTGLRGSLPSDIFALSSLGDLIGGIDLNQKASCLLVAQHWMGATLGKRPAVPLPDTWTSICHAPYCCPMPSARKEGALIYLGWTEFDSSSVTPVTSAAGSPDSDVFVLLKTALSVSLINHTFVWLENGLSVSEREKTFFRGQEMIQVLLKPPAPFQMEKQNIPKSI